MHITKYPQSCLKIEKDDRSLLIDVGTLATKKYKVAEFGKFDAVLFTHCHADHFDVTILDELRGDGDILLYGNADTAAAAGEHPIEVLDEGEELVIAGFKMKVYAMKHCLMPDGSAATIENTGFMIDDTFLIPGDSTELLDVKPIGVALPIFGPDISYKDAFVMARHLAVRDVVPVHYDVAGMDPASFEMFSRMFKAPWTVHALADGESVVM